MIVTGCLCSTNPLHSISDCSQGGNSVPDDETVQSEWLKSPKPNSVEISLLDLLGSPGVDGFMGSLGHRSSLS